MKTLLAFLLLATTASAGHIFEFRIEETSRAALDVTPENPFDSVQEIEVIETFYADAQPFQVDILRWDFVADDGTMLASVAPYTIDMPFLLQGLNVNQYRTTDDSPTPWGEDIVWIYNDFLSSHDELVYKPSSGDRVTKFQVLKLEGLYFVPVSRGFAPIPEPATHIMLALVGLLAWCVARRGRA